MQTTRTTTVNYKPAISTDEQGTHILFWIIAFAILIWIDPQESAFGLVLGKNVLQLVFFAVIVYANILYFFPEYLKDRNIWKHLGYLIVFSIILTPIKIVTFFVIYSSSPDIQLYFLHNIFNIFLSCFLLAMATTLFSILRDWVNTRRLQQEIHNKNLETELNFLKSQINPHFLFNTLNNLYALTLKKSDKAPEIVLRLSEMMRYMLYECNEAKVPLTKELQFIKSYIELEKIRQGTGFDIKLAISGDCNKCMIAPQLLIPFIENCFKHGVNKAIKEGFVEVNIEVYNRELQMVVANSKAPQPQESKDKRLGGIGLTNVRRRLNLLYPDAYQLNINNSIDRYEVNFTLSLEKITTHTIVT